MHLLEWRYSDRSFYFRGLFFDGFSRTQAESVAKLTGAGLVEITNFGWNCLAQQAHHFNEGPRTRSHLISR